MPSLNSPILTGDVSGGLHTTQVDKLKGQPVAITAPTSGQVLTWDGTQWAPATNSTGGGGGANGLTYYLNQSTDADAPTTNIPGTPKQLGRTGQTTQVDVTTGTLTADTWTLVAGFVSEATPQDPATILIPAGLWDFNVWALGVADQNHSNSIRARAYIYNGTTLTALGTSAVQTITETSAQYGLSMLVEQTTILATDRIYVAIEALATANGHTVTAQFGDNTPSHVHTSLPLVGGTGLWKNVAGVLQSPASLLVDADVDPAAAIAQSKISGLSDSLASKAKTAQVQVFDTVGTHTWTKPEGAKLVDVIVIPGGGGGGSGASVATGLSTGGGGGGGGARTITTLDASLIGATETVTVGAGGAGGAARVAGQNGIQGGIGGASSFGVWASASPGGGGGAGSSTTGASGGASGTRGLFSGTSGAVSSATGTGGSNSSSSNACPGGGSGGGVTAANAPTVGGTGGFGSLYNGIAQTATPANGNGASVPAGVPYGGNGGGGGNASTTGPANAGGNGGFYGAGGGGGGAGGLGQNSGAGGNGAQGIVVVTTYF